MSSRSKPPTSSLTPQRKHRKLLKDGSGTEVWPESIEKIFVKGTYHWFFSFSSHSKIFIFSGLREYWDSPWATYSQSRGRSRWRNQFLVDYLHKAGIDRSKKQVASHIQVLRNMWKGEPEFYLVAGGEEPAADTPVKLEDGSLISLDFDETDSSSNSASPDFSPPELQSDFPPTPGQYTSGYAFGSHSPPSKDSVSPYASPEVYSTSMPNSLSVYPVDMAGFHSHDQLPIQNTHYSLNAYQGHHHSYSSKPIALQPPSERVSTMGAYPSYPQSPSRATSICFAADGMVPLSIKLDALMSAPPSERRALTLQIRLCITAEDGIRGASGQDGFFATVSLSRVWNMSGKCITRVYTNSLCTSEVMGALDVSNIEMGTVNAILPESTLSRCRWLDASVPTRITQEIIVDDETLLYLIYDLDRSMGSIPSAKLIRWATMTKPTSSTPPAAHPPQPTPYQGYPNSTFPTSTRSTAHSSISSALSPHTRHAMSTSMPF
ncbi:hypothetical protein H0H87_000050 [Tephrocybe sp. NHM501043]|nr:hypothetical protein H0H87_000050 [Tephrocybe sp. NHM501043]